MPWKHREEEKASMGRKGVASEPRSVDSHSARIGEAARQHGAISKGNCLPYAWRACLANVLWASTEQHHEHLCFQDADVAGERQVSG